MKKNISIVTLLSGFALLIVGALILSSCEGPMGPAGPGGDDGAAGPTGANGAAGPAGAAGGDGTNGADGINGVDGLNGADGVDGNGTCIVCHDADVVLLAKQQQALSSHHLEGGNYARNHTDCSICHNHQGFVAWMETGLEPVSDVMDPAPITCRTCHMIHVNYDDTDWMLVDELPVVLTHGDATVDLGGPSNLCVNCHMSRAISSFPVVGGPDVSITSSRWGPHHGPQGNNLWGVGGYEIAGTMPYPAAGSHFHVNVGCVDCHMAPIPYGGIDAGGHTFNMTYSYHGSVVDNSETACVRCHADLDDSFDYKGVQTTIDGLVADLETIFIAKGFMDDEPDALWNASSTVPLVVTADEAGAMINYKTITEDRSKGVHNADYMIALLTNSLESLAPAR
jgi:hypothetical protein